MIKRDRYDPLILVIDNFFCKDSKSEQKIGTGEGDSYDEEAENHVWPEGEDNFMNSLLLFRVRKAELLRDLKTF